MIKFFQSLIIASVCAAAIAAVTPSQAAILNQGTADQINNNANVVGTKAGFDSNTTVAGVVATVIKGFLGLMGIIFVILIIVAGFNWMTAGGNEEQVQKATALIRNAVIGLIIVVAAYAIPYFIFANLPDGSSGLTPPS